MGAFTDLVLRHRALVVVVWLAVAVAGAVTAPSTVSALSYDFALPGQPAYEANQQITRDFGGGGAVDPLVLTAHGEPGEFSEADAQRSFSRSAEQVAGSAPDTRVVTPQNSPGDVLVSDDGSQAVALMYPRVVEGPEPYAAALPAIERSVAAADAEGASLQLTGTLLLEESGGSDRGVLIEVVLGAAGALIVLLLVFASLLAGLPLLVAAVSILGTFVALLGLTTVTDVSFVVQYLVALIGLGVAIDYSLLIVMRWREERALGAANDEAVRIAMRTAGRSVLFSAVTVAVSLAALIAVPLPFLRSIGLGGLLIPLLSVAVSVTLVPVLLQLFGPRLEWPRRRLRDPSSRGWAAIAGFTVRRPWIVIGVSTLLLLVMAAPLLGLRLGSPAVESYPTTSEAGRSAAAITDAGITPGVLRPTQVLVPTVRADSAAAQLAALPGVAAAQSPGDPGWSRDDTTLVQVYFDADAASAEGSRTLDAVRALAAGPPDGDDWRVGGSPAEDADFISAVYGNAPLVLAIIVVITFLLLARALRSIWLPVKALVLNMISLAAAYGMTVLIWQDGVGTELLFGLEATGALTAWVPVAVFAFLFGLSMDYEVFILARMREAYDEHGHTDRAVVDGIARTGRLVTSAALILFLSFIALSTVPVIDVKILATALALGIAIDALVVRALLAPALVAVLGHYNWSLPARFDRARRD